MASRSRICLTALHRELQELVGLLLPTSEPEQAPGRRFPGNFSLHSNVSIVNNTWLGSQFASILVTSQASPSATMQASRVLCVCGGAGSCPDLRCTQVFASTYTSPWTYQVGAAAA